MARGKPHAEHVDLTGTLELLRGLVTQTLCQRVFRKVRTTERERDWSLFALVQFWLAVVLRAPESLRHALAEAREGREPLVDFPGTSDEAFFQRSRDLRWEFFAEVFDRFLAAVLPHAEPRYTSTLGGLRERFAEVLVVDGSRLAAIARKLKILWNERAVVLPGCLLAAYDLFRGIPRLLDFCADAAKSELHRAIEALRDFPRGTLLLGDRLYGCGAFFQELHQRRLWGLFRRDKRWGLRRVGRKPLRKKRLKAGLLVEWLVEAGCGATAPVQRLRLIRRKQGRQVRELLTNVLDPDRLTAEEAMMLYPKRWSVERMFFDLKEVLNLNRVYAANPNAVGMQVYAAAIVYVAFRVAQGEVAHQAGLTPEEISPAKFFPKMAAACYAYFEREYGVEEVLRMNRGKRLRRPNWRGRRFVTARVDDIRVRPRNGTRRRRRFCASRRKWKSFFHVKGGRKLT